MTSLGTVEINVRLNTNDLDDQLKKLKNINLKPDIDLSDYKKGVTVPVSFSEKSYERELSSIKRKLSKDLKIEAKLKIKAEKIEDKEKRKIEKDLKKEIRINTKLNIDTSDAERKLKALEKAGNKPINKDVVLRIKKVDYRSVPNEITVTPVLSRNAIKKIRTQLEKETFTIKTKTVTQNVSSNYRQSAPPPTVETRVGLSSGSSKTKDSNKSILNNILNVNLRIEKSLELVVRNTNELYQLQKKSAGNIFTNALKGIGKFVGDLTMSFAGAVFSGFGERFGNALADKIIERFDLDEKLNKKLDDIAVQFEKIAQKTSKFVTKVRNRVYGSEPVEGEEDEESGTAVHNAGAKIRNGRKRRAAKVKYVKEQVIPAVKEVFNPETFKPDAQELGRAVKTLRLPIRQNKKSNARAVARIKKSLVGLYDVPAKNINKRTERILQQLTEEIEKRAEEIKKGLPDELGKDNVIFAIGGFSGNQGKGGEKLAREIEQRFQESYVVPISNHLYDISQPIAENVPKAIYEVLFKKILKTTLVDGSIPTTAEYVAQAKAYAEKYNVPISTVGYSGGGFVAQQGQEVLDKVGVKVPTVAIGTPQTGYLQKHKKNLGFKSYMSKKDPIGKVMGPLRKGAKNIVESEGAETDVKKAHSIGNYFEDAPVMEDIRKTFDIANRVKKAPPKVKTNDDLKKLLESINVSYNNLNKKIVLYKKVGEGSITDLQKDVDDFVEYIKTISRAYADIPLIGEKLAPVIEKLKSEKLDIKTGSELREVIVGINSTYKELYQKINLYEKSGKGSVLDIQNDIEVFVDYIDGISKAYSHIPLIAERLEPKIKELNTKKESIKKPSVKQRRAYKKSEKKEKKNDFKQNVKPAIAEVFDPDTFKDDTASLVTSVKEFKLPTKKNRPDNRKAVVKVKRDLTNLSNVVGANINKRRDLILQQLEVDITNRAEEIKKDLPDILGKDNVIVAIGGFSGSGGKESETVAEEIQKTFQDSYVVPVANAMFDTSIAFTENAPKWLWEVVSKKILRTNIVEGTIPDTKEFAATVKAYAEKYNVPVSAIGFSSGGFTVEQSIDILDKMGVQKEQGGTKGATVATPQTGYLKRRQGRQNKNVKSYLAKNDGIVKMFKPIMGKPGEDFIQSQGVPKPQYKPGSFKEGFAGHNIKNYMGDAEVVASITENFNLGKKPKSGAELVKQIQNIGASKDKLYAQIEEYQKNGSGDIKKIKNDIDKFTKYLGEISEIYSHIPAIGEKFEPIIKNLNETNEELKNSLVKNVDIFSLDNVEIPEKPVAKVEKPKPILKTRKPKPVLKNKPTTPTTPQAPVQIPLPKLRNKPEPQTAPAGRRGLNLPKANLKLKVPVSIPLGGRSKATVTFNFNAQNILEKLGLVNSPEKSSGGKSYRKPLNKTAAEIEADAKTLKEKYNAKGLEQISRGMGVPVGAKNRGFDEVAKNLAKYENLPDIESYANTLGESVKRIQKQSEGVKKVLVNEENTIRLYKDFTISLNQRIQLYEETRNGNVQNINDDIDNYINNIDEIIKSYEYKPETGKALGGYKRQLIAKKQKLAEISGKPFTPVVKVSAKPTVPVVQTPKPVTTIAPIQRRPNIRTSAKPEVNIQAPSVTSSTVPLPEHQSQKQPTIPKIEELNTDDEINSFIASLEPTYKKLNKRILLYAKRRVGIAENIKNDIDFFVAYLDEINKVYGNIPIIAEKINPIISILKQQNKILFGADELEIQTPEQVSVPKPVISTPEPTPKPAPVKKIPDVKTPIVPEVKVSTPATKPVTKIDLTKKPELTTPSKPVVKNVATPKVTPVATQIQTSVSSPIVTPVTKPALTVLKPVNLPKNQLAEIAKKLREEFTAKGLFQIAKSLGVKVSGQQRNLEPLSELIAQSASFPDIQIVAKQLGDSVKRSSKKTGAADIRPMLNSEDDIIKHLKEANKNLNVRIKNYSVNRDESVDKINEDIDNYIKGIDEILKIYKYDGVTGKALGGLIVQLKEKQKYIANISALPQVVTPVIAPEPKAKVVAKKPKVATVKPSTPVVEVKPATISTPKPIVAPVVEPVVTPIQSTGDIEKPKIEQVNFNKIQDLASELDAKAIQYSILGKGVAKDITKDINEFIAVIDKITKTFDLTSDESGVIAEIKSNLELKNDVIVNGPLSSRIPKPDTYKSGDELETEEEEPKPKKTRASNARPPKAKESSATATPKETMQPVINGLNARAIKDYKAIFKELGKKLGVDIEKITIPNINVKTDFAVDGVKASYEETLNAVSVAPELLDILNAGIGESIDKLGEDTVNESLSILIHELTHAFQAGVSKISIDDIFKGQPVINVQAFDIPNPGEDLAKIIDDMVEMSTQGFIESLKNANPGASYAQINKQYAVLIKEVRRREIEAYKAEAVYSQEVIKSVKSRANKKGNKSKDDLPVHPARGDLGGEKDDSQQSDLPLHSFGIEKPIPAISKKEQKEAEKERLKTEKLAEKYAKREERVRLKTEKLKSKSPIVQSPTVQVSTPKISTSTPSEKEQRKADAQSEKDRIKAEIKAQKEKLKADLKSNKQQIHQSKIVNGLTERGLENYRKIFDDLAKLVGVDVSDLQPPKISFPATMANSSSGYTKAGEYDEKTYSIEVNSKYFPKAQDYLNSDISTLSQQPGGIKALEEGGFEVIVHELTHALQSLVQVIDGDKSKVGSKDFKVPAPRDGAGILKTPLVENADLAASIEEQLLLSSAGMHPQKRIAKIIGMGTVGGSEEEIRKNHPGFEKYFDEVFPKDFENTKQMEREAYTMGYGSTGDIIKGFQKPVVEPIIKPVETPVVKPISTPPVVAPVVKTPVVSVSTLSEKEQRKADKLAEKQADRKAKAEERRAKIVEKYQKKAEKLGIQTPNLPQYGFGLGNIFKNPFDKKSEEEKLKAELKALDKAEKKSEIEELKAEIKELDKVEDAKEIEELKAEIKALEEKIKDTERADKDNTLTKIGEENYKKIFEDLAKLVNVDVAGIKPPELSFPSLDASLGGEYNPKKYRITLNQTAYPDVRDILNNENIGDESKIPGEIEYMADSGISSLVHELTHALQSLVQIKPEDKSVIDYSKIPDPKAGWGQLKLPQIKDVDDLEYIEKSALLSSEGRHPQEVINRLIKSGKYGKTEEEIRKNHPEGSKYIDETLPKNYQDVQKIEREAYTSQFQTNDILKGFQKNEIIKPVETPDISSPNLPLYSFGGIFGKNKSSKVDASQSLIKNEGILTEKGLENYRKIFAVLAKTVGVNVKNVEPPKIETFKDGQDSLGSFDSTNYTVGLNTEYKDASNKNIIDFLNSDFKNESEKPDGIQSLSNGLEILVHELTHALQSIVQIPENDRGTFDYKNGLPSPDSGGGKLKIPKAKTEFDKGFIEKGAKLSSQYVLEGLNKEVVKHGVKSIEELRKLKPSLVEVIEEIHQEVLQIEREAYAAGAILTQDIVKNLIQLPDLLSDFSVNKDDKNNVSIPEISKEQQKIIDKYDKKREKLQEKFNKQKQKAEIKSTKPPSLPLYSMGSVSGGKKPEPKVQTSNMNARFIGEPIKNEINKSNMNVRFIDFIENEEKSEKELAERKVKYKEKRAKILSDYDEKAKKLGVTPVKVPGLDFSKSKLKNPRQIPSLDFSKSIVKNNDLNVGNIPAKDSKGFQSRIKKYLSDLYNLPSNYINKKRKAIYKQLEQDIYKRSEEIKKGLPDSITKGSVILAIGGFAGEGGGSSVRIANNIQEKFQESLVVPVANKYFDVINVAEKNLIGWLSEIVFSKVIKTNFVDAVIPDTKEFAAQAKAYAKKYNVPVAGAGFSGGGFIVQQSIDLLEQMGMSMKGVGIATPATGYLDQGKANPNYQAYIAKNDPIGKMMMGLNKANVVTQGAPTLQPGESGHGIKNYLEDADAMSSISGHLGISNKPIVKLPPFKSLNDEGVKSYKKLFKELGKLLKIDIEGIKLPQIEKYKGNQSLSDGDKIGAQYTKSTNTLTLNDSYENVIELLNSGIENAIDTRGLSDVTNDLETVLHELTHAIQGFLEKTKFPEKINKGDVDNPTHIELPKVDDKNIIDYIERLSEKSVNATAERVIKENVPDYTVERLKNENPDAFKTVKRKEVEAYTVQKSLTGVIISNLRSDGKSVIPAKPVTPPLPLYSVGSVLGKSKKSYKKDLDNLLLNKKGIEEYNKIIKKLAENLKLDIELFKLPKIDKLSNSASDKMGEYIAELNTIFLTAKDINVLNEGVAKTIEKYGRGVAYNTVEILVHELTHSFQKNLKDLTEKYGIDVTDDLIIPEIKNPKILSQIESGANKSTDSFVNELNNNPEMISGIQEALSSGISQKEIDDFKQGLFDNQKKKEVQAYSIQSLFTGKIVDDISKEDKKVTNALRKTTANIFKNITNIFKSNGEFVKIERPNVPEFTYDLNFEDITSEIDDLSVFLNSVELNSDDITSEIDDLSEFLNNVELNFDEPTLPIKSGTLLPTAKPVTPQLPLYLYSVGSVASKAKKAISDVTAEVEAKITDITENLEAIKKIAKKRPNIRRKLSEARLNVKPGVASDYLEAAENIQAASAKVFVKTPGKREDRKERFRQKKEAAIFERELAEKEARKQAASTGLPYKQPKIKPITVTASDVSGKVLELSEQVKAASEDWEQNVKPAVAEVFAPQNFAEEAKGLVENIGEYRAAKKEKRLEDKAAKKKSAFAKIKKSLKNLYEVPAKKINERQDRILADLAVDVEKRAQEIIATLPDALPDGKDNTLFAIGGFAGEKGKSSHRLADQVQEKFQGSHVVPVENTGSDTTAPITHDPISWVKEVVKRKVLRTNVVEGANPDTTELAAQMLAHSRKYGQPVNAIGYSGGGFVAQQAQRVLSNMGVESKAVGIGTPQVGYLEDQRNNGEQSKGFRSYMAKFDPLAKLRKGRNVKQTRGVVAPDSGDGHAIKNYLGQAKTVASITSFLGLKAQDSGKGLGFFARHIKNLKDKFEELKPSLDFTVRRFNLRNSQIGQLVDFLPKLVKNIGQAIPALKPFTDNLEALFSAGISYRIFEFFGKALLSVGKICIETAARFQKLETVTNFIAGSNENAAKTFDFLSSEVSRLSIDTESAITGWNKLAATTRGTVLEGDATKAIFSGISQAGAAFSLTGDEVQGSILSMSQIASKGTVSMEELRGQLSEKIPGAMQIAARSMGMTEQGFNDLVNSGKLAATDFLPKFAKQLSLETAGGAEDSTKNITASMTRFNNSLTALKVNAGKPLLPMVAVGLDVVAKAMDSVAKYAGLLSRILVITVGVAFKDYIKTVWTLTVTLVKNEFTLKAIMARILTIGNVIWKFFIPKLVAMAPQILIFYALSKAVEVLYFAFDTFMSKTKGDVINKNLSKNFDEAGKKADELREKLAKLRGEIETKGEKEKPKTENVTNFKLARKKQEEDKKNDTLFDKVSGFKNLSRGMEDWTAKSKDIKEKRTAKTVKESASTGELKTLSTNVENILSSSDLIIAKSKEKTDAIGKLTVQAKSAEGKNLEDIKKQIEVLQLESNVELFKVGDNSLGLANIDSTAESVSSTIATLKDDLAGTVSDEPKKVLTEQIAKLEEYKEKLDELSEQMGSSDLLTQFLTNISKIGAKFEKVSYDTDKALIKIKKSINKNLKENLTTDVKAENNASLEQVRADVFATQAKLKASKDMADSLTGTLKASGGEVGENYKKYSDTEKYPLQKLQSELEKTDEKDIARKSTLEALIKLRESENTTLDLQSTLQEQLLQQERERFRVAQENLDREIAISRAKVDISDANAQSVSVRRQIMGGSSQADIGLIDADNQLKSAQQKEVLRQQELAGIRKLHEDKLISAKDYETKVRELTVQGAQNSLAILQAKLGEEQALRAKEVENIQRTLEQSKVQSEAEQADKGFYVERKGFEVQQTNLKEQVSTGKSDELNKQLEYQKQLFEKSGDISKQEKINAEIYQNQLTSLTAKQDLQTKSLELTQAQQRLEMQRSDMQAKIALLEAESQVNQLIANKATAEEISVAQQTVDIRKQQVNFVSEQRKNLGEVQKLEKDNLTVQNETQKKDAKRSRNLQLIEEAEKRITKEVEITKNQNDIINKQLERKIQLTNSNSEVYKAQSEALKSQVDYNIEIANKSNNIKALEVLKFASYSLQLQALNEQNKAQSYSLELSHKQQRIQAENDILDAQANLRKLELNKASKQDIDIAKRQLKSSKEQLTNVEAIQQNETERVGVEQQSALANLERQRYLEIQELEIQKTTKEIENQTKLYDAQQTILQSTGELDKQRLDFQLELANRSNDFNKIEQLKAEIYLQQRKEILRQNESQKVSLELSQKQNNIELDRQLLQAKSGLLQAQLNLEKGKLEGLSENELHNLEQFVIIQGHHLAGITEQKILTDNLNGLQKENLDIQQQAKLEQIDQQRQLELQDLAIQKITKSFEKEKAELEFITSQLDLQNAELDRQSALQSAKSGLNDSVSNLEKQRLDFRMQLAELSENEVQKQQIKQQLYEQELKSLAQRQEIERETLKIAQQKQDIDIKRQETLAEIATLEAQVEIEKAKARGAGSAEMAALEKVLALRKQQEKSVQADKENVAKIQELEKQKLNIDQTAANENLQQQRILDQARAAKEQQQKNSEKGGKGGVTYNAGVSVNAGVTYNSVPAQPIYLSEADRNRKPVSGMTTSDYGKTSTDAKAKKAKDEIIESMKVTATNVYINGNVSDGNQNVNNQNQNSDLEKMKKIENDINKLAEESRLQKANAAIDDYINKWNNEAEKERIASGLTAKQATAGGYEQAKIAREEAAKITADLASGKLKTTGADGFTPQQIKTPLQKLQEELQSAQKAVDSSKKQPKPVSKSEESGGGTNVNVENLVIVSNDPTGDARQVLNDLAANKGKC
jgi:tape measure domain-containing protein